ncbi:notch-regulated ankyrin repeat-containing protein [Echinops telfairi]|uniref:Notch-regulated ankyrin repeat-containing protein n=1 Tax=Echinops telfairi TaxID=9371 RepID=A0ABM0ZTA5_ECHTE|nr:notch-regulated ankyrin repeat-containing protein [Echinops telfairi]
MGDSGYGHWAEGSERSTGQASDLVQRCRPAKLTSSSLPPPTHYIPFLNFLALPETSLDLAELLAELSTCSAPQTQRIFQEAVRKGNTQELQSLLQNMTNCEFNVNSFGPEGQTALHQSVIDGNLELVKLLVKFGADIRLANRDGWSALHIAAFGGHQDIALYLITKAKYAASGR